jgi:hypothetical protein
MCFGGTPKMPAVPEPVRPQEAKQPAQGAFGSTSTARKNMQSGGGGAAAASTLLTGPSGVENRQLQLQKNTLLGM